LPFFSLLHTYLLAITELKLSVDHFGFAALHSADKSKIESPSGASAGQFLLDCIFCIFFVDLRAYGQSVEEEENFVSEKNHTSSSANLGYPDNVTCASMVLFLGTRQPDRGYPNLLAPCLVNCAFHARLFEFNDGLRNPDADQRKPSRNTVIRNLGWHCLTTLLLSGCADVATKGDRGPSV
jgi:hypothetical protein